MAQQPGKGRDGMSGTNGERGATADAASPTPAGAGQTRAPTAARSARRHAPETRRAYAADWAAFAAWGRRSGHPALPAAPATVCAYLDSLAGRLGPGALARRVAAIAAQHRAAGHSPPSADPDVRARLRTVRSLARAEADAAPLPRPRVRRHPRPGPATLARMAALCLGDTAGQRDRCLLLLMAAGLPGPAVLALDAEHVRETRYGLELLLGGQRGNAAGERLPLAGGPVPGQCPVRALQDWLTASDGRFGPVFRKVDRWGNVEHQRLSADGLRRIVRRRATAWRKRRRADQAV